MGNDQAVEAGHTAAAKKLWDQAMEIGGTACINHPAARAYFEARGIDVGSLPPWTNHRLAKAGELPPSIRYHPAVAYKKGDFRAAPGPCLLIQVSDREGAFRSVHRIWLELDGSPRKRSDVPDAKLSWVGSVAGCAMRFGDPDPDLGILTVGEGPETMLAIAAACQCATWATGGPGLLNFELPESLVAPELAIVREVVFMGDHEQAGVFKADESMIGRECLMRPGWNYAAAGAVRLKAKYPHLEARVAVPGMSFSKPPLFIEPKEGASGTAVDAFAETVDPRAKIDWLNVYETNGADAVFSAWQYAKPISRRNTDDFPTVPAVFLATAPLARKFLTEGVDKKYLLDVDKQAGLERELAAAKKRDALQEIRDAVDPKSLFPKHTALRARFSLNRFYTPAAAENERWILAYWIENSQWMIWTGKRYRLMKEHEVAGHLVHNLLNLKHENKSGRVVDVDLTSNFCKDVANAILPQVTVRGDGLPFMASPTFDDKGEPIWQTSLEQLLTPEVAADSTVSREEACDLLNFSNGMLSISEFVKGRVVMRKHSPRVISRSLVPFELDTKALQAELDADPEGVDRGGKLVARLCPTWLRVLDQAFNSDQESIGELQKVGGYLQIEDMTHEILPVLLGPPRGGKGTIAMGLSVGIGEDRVATTSFSSFGDKNETYNLVGRRAAFMTDAQQADPREMHRIVERLKTITGGDPQSVEGKFKDKNPYIYLPVVPFIISNNVPRLIDPSNALAARVIMFQTLRSFKDNKDTTLKAKIRAEAPGIMLWCLFGLRALRMDGKFYQPEASRDLLEQFMRLSSPMSAFIKDACVAHPESECGLKILYQLYKAWATDAGLGIPGKEKFLSDLQSNVPYARLVSATARGKHASPLKVIKGVRPRMHGEEIGTAPSAYRVHEWTPNDWATFEFSLPGAEDDYAANGGTRETAVREYPQYQQGEFGI